MTTLLEKLRESADEVIGQMDAIETRAAERNDHQMDDAEQANMTELRSQLETLESRIRSATETAAARQRVAAMRPETTTEKPSATRSVVPAAPRRKSDPDTGHVDGEPPTYHPHNQGLFLRDIVAAHCPSLEHRMAYVTGDENHRQRLNRHQRMTVANGDLMTRNIETSNLSGLIVPQYRRDLLAPALHNGKVVAALARDMGFPTEGVQIVIPRTNTASTIGIQTDEDEQVSETSPATASITVDMTTVGAFADVSVQAIEQGSMSEAFLLEDLGLATGAAIENQVVNGTGSSGQVTGLLNVSSNTDETWTQTTPAFAGTGGGAWGGITSLITAVATARKRRPDCLVFSQRTWGWLAAQLDTTNRPLYGTLGQGPTANIGVGDFAPDDSRLPMPVGSIMGVNCYVSDAVPINLAATTNQSRILAFSRSDLLISESSRAPTVVAQLETSDARLNIRFTAYSFLFFTAARYPAGIGVLSGTGLTAGA